MKIRIGIVGVSGYAGLELIKLISRHQEIEFVAAVRQGMAELDRGESVTIEKIENELPSWIIK